MSLLAFLEGKLKNANTTSGFVFDNNDRALRLGKEINVLKAKNQICRVKTTIYTPSVIRSARAGN